MLSSNAYTRHPSRQNCAKAEPNLVLGSASLHSVTRHSLKPSEFMENLSIDGISQDFPSLMHLIIGQLVKAFGSGGEYEKPNQALSPAYQSRTFLTMKILET